MRLKGRYLLLLSVTIFVLNFLTLLNLNFTKNPGLQILGTIIALVSVVIFLAGLVLGIKHIFSKGISLKKQAVVAERKQSSIFLKRLIGVFVILWIFVVFPLIAMGQTGLIYKITEGFPSAGSNIGAISGMMIFVPLVMVATIYPGLYFSPLVIFPLILLPLAVYLIFSRSWHRVADSILFLLLITCLIGQLILYFRLTG